MDIIINSKEGEHIIVQDIRYLIKKITINSYAWMKITDPYKCIYIFKLCDETTGNITNLLFYEKNIQIYNVKLNYDNEYILK